jgi:hypothetical protein
MLSTELKLTCPCCDGDICSWKIATTRNYYRLSHCGLTNFSFQLLGCQCYWFPDLDLSFCAIWMQMGVMYPTILRMKLLGIGSSHGKEDKAGKLATEARRWCHCQRRRPTQEQPNSTKAHWSTPMIGRTLPGHATTRAAAGTLLTLAIAASSSTWRRGRWWQGSFCSS